MIIKQPRQNSFCDSFCANILTASEVQSSLSDGLQEGCEDNEIVEILVDFAGLENADTEESRNALINQKLAKMDEDLETDENPEEDNNLQPEDTLEEMAITAEEVHGIDLSLPLLRDLLSDTPILPDSLSSTAPHQGALSEKPKKTKLSRDSMLVDLTKGLF